MACYGERTVLCNYWVSQLNGSLGNDVLATEWGVRN